MERRLNMLEKWLVRILCALSLVFVGFAHLPPALAADPANPADYVQYVLPDGALPTLCVTVTDSDGKTTDEHKLHSQGCEACRISAAVLLPTPVDDLGKALAFAMPATHVWRVDVIHRRIHPPNGGPQPPPADLFPA